MPIALLDTAQHSPLGAPLEQLEHFERYRDKGLGWHVERPELLELRDFVLQRLGPDAASRLIELDDGTSAQVGKFEIHGIASAHPTVERDASGRCRFLGFVVRWNGLAFFDLTRIRRAANGARHV